MAGTDDAGSAADSGFLSRWSRRKGLVRQGVALAEPPVLPQPQPQPVAAATVAELPAAQAPLPPAPAADAPPAAAPLPTLADVALLDHQSDFSRFVAPGVDTGVKNAALKKLFTDPHFNVMDRLDTYIDDYGLPDPLPEGMLRLMAQAQFLGLFSSEAEAPAADQPTLDGSPVANPTALPAPPSDEDPALRLQPLDAAGPAGPDQGPGPDPGRQL